MCIKLDWGRGRGDWNENWGEGGGEGGSEGGGWMMSRVLGWMTAFGLKMQKYNGTVIHQKVFTFDLDCKFLARVLYL